MIASNPTVCYRCVHISVEVGCHEALIDRTQVHHVTLIVVIRGTSLSVIVLDHNCLVSSQVPMRIVVVFLRT